ncbi:conserved hypothetical protein [Thiomonas sp. X19]|nr:conserved hypothetical protein [Thiomonas sp. X19]
MPSQCLANHRERSISAPLSKKTRRTDQSDSLGFKSDSLLAIHQISVLSWPQEQFLCTQHSFPMP